jgi:hypothetical protein
VRERELRDAAISSIELALFGDEQERSRDELVERAYQAVRERDEWKEIADQRYETQTRYKLRTEAAERGRDEALEVTRGAIASAFDGRVSAENDLVESEARVRDLEAAHEAHVSERWCPICDPDLAAAVAPEAEERCGACGSADDVAYRGWHDDGAPMPTCADCGAPEAEEKPRRVTPVTYIGGGVVKCVGCGEYLLEDELHWHPVEGAAAGDDRKETT